MTPQQQTQYLDLLSRGAAPAKACEVLEVTPEAVEATVLADDDFCDRLARLSSQLSENVKAALYRKAMEGVVSAQIHFLRKSPPPEWQAAPADAPRDELDDLGEDELLAILQQTELRLCRPT